MAPSKILRLNFKKLTYIFLQVTLFFLIAETYGNVRFQYQQFVNANTNTIYLSLLSFVHKVIVNSAASKVTIMFIIIIMQFPIKSVFNIKKSLSQI